MPSHLKRRTTVCIALATAALALALALLVSHRPAHAQHAQGGGAVPASGTPPREAAQFDFLIGLWELDVTPKVSSMATLLHGAPKLSGVWKAWKAMDGFGVEDELRIVDGSANPVTLAHALRVWDARAARWNTHTLDVYRARLASSQAQWQDGEMRLQGNSTTPEGKPTLTRGRFFDISANGFKLRQDRSLDNGATWEEGVLLIVARRSAAKAAR